jgi:transposase InsO family protein
MLRIENGLEFCNEAFDSFCAASSIARHKTTAGTPQQNSLAKRFNRTILERVRCMSTIAGLKKVFWVEVVSTTTYPINRYPPTVLDIKTPEEIWSGHPPDLDKIRVFGCIAYAHIRQDKVEPRSLRCMFIGYPEGVKSYRLWFLKQVTGGVSPVER